MPVPYKARKRESLMALSSTARRVHRAILDGFARTGTAPADSWDDDALAELIEQDIIVVSDSGEIRAAYPFSAVPTNHRVLRADGPVVHAMCAIDALGMSAMLDSPLTIRSAEPVTEEIVTVKVDRRTASWQPDTAVVFVGTRRESCEPSADRACGFINFFTTAEAANAWAAGHPEIEGTVLSQRAALFRGVAEFGDFMRPG